MFNRLSRLAPSQLPTPALPALMSSLSTGRLLASSSRLFKELPVSPETHRLTKPETSFKPLGANSLRAFSSERDSLDNLRFIADRVKTEMRRFEFSDKPSISQTSCLKDGRSVNVRRLCALDAELICDFYAHAGPWSMFDSMASPANKVSNICDIIFNAANIGSDALVAVVGGKIVGLCEYEVRVGEMEHEVDRAMLDFSSLSAADVCIAKTMIVQSARDCGVGTALKREQMRSARSAGYKAIASLSLNPAMLRIITKMGGSINRREFGAAWSLIGLEPSKALVALPVLPISSALPQSSVPETVRPEPASAA